MSLRLGVLAQFTCTAITATCLALLIECHVMAATKFWKNSVPSGNWNTGTNWSAIGPSGADVGGVPVLNEPVRIYNTNGAAHTVTLNTSPPALGLLVIDLPAAGALTNTLSLTTNNSLTAAGIYVGGHNGSGFTAGNGVLTQSAGTITASPGNDLYIGLGTGSTGVYNLSGGALNANLSTVVGSGGTGTFNHSGGTHTLIAEAIGGALLVGYLAGGNGTYNLSDTGQLIANKNEIIGVDGVGQFFQTGGTNTVSGSFVLHLGLNPGSQGTYNLSAGSLAVNNHQFIGYAGVGQFNQSGGSNNVANLIIADQATGQGAYAISGGTLTVGNNAVVGQLGTGTLTIQNQSSVHVGNTLTVGNGDTLNLQGGTLRFNDLDNQPGSTINYTGGTVKLAGGNPRFIGFDPDIATLFGASPTIPAGKALILEAGGSHKVSANLLVNGGALTVESILNVGQSGASTVQIINNGSVSNDSFINIGFTSNGAVVVGSGGTLTTDDLVLGGFTATANLDIQAGGTVSTSVFEFGQLGTLNLLGGTLRLSSMLNTNNDPGFLNFNSGTISLTGDRSIGSDEIIEDFFGVSPTLGAGKNLSIDGTAILQASKTVTLSGGTLTAGTLLMTPGSRVVTTESSQIIGVLTGLAGSAIDVFSNLTIGNAAAVQGFATQGTLRVGANTVTLLDANDAVFDSLAVAALGDGDSPGTLSAANGLTLDFGGNIIGYGTLSTPNSVTKPLINNGHITGTSATEKITLPGYVKGVGTFDNVNFTGTFAPGLSPTSLVVGNVGFSNTSTLVMEIGGTSPGSSYDQIISSGALALDGALQIALVSGFNPLAGQSFNLLDWASVSGTFDTLTLPTLASGLAWNTSQLYTNGIISVAAAAGLDGDFNHDGAVDAADYVAWRKGAGVATTTPNYNLWRTNFGRTAGGGGAAAPGSAAVPEPNALASLALAMIGLLAPPRSWAVAKNRC